MAEIDHSGARTKRCTRCVKVKLATLEEFPPHKPGKYGLHSLCLPCKKESDAERRSRPDQLARQKAWRDANKDKVRAYNEAYRAAGYKSTQHVSEWRKLNIEHARKYAREKQQRRLMDPEYRLRGRISARLNSMLHGKAGRSTEELLGYTAAQLMAHLEKQFTRGMSWELFRRGVIEIDHIIPVRHFKITNVEDPDFRACWDLCNLRPMWAKDNRSKGGKVLTLL